MKSLAQKIVFTLISELQGRKGFNAGFWSELDDEIREEILERMVALVDVEIENAKEAST